MPTELLFREDAYLQTAHARVTAIHEDGNELDRTVFYPMGGGQGDTGTLRRGDGESLAVIDTRKGEGQDAVLHRLSAVPQRLTLGEPLHLALDWPRRYALMRLHTALHVMSCVVRAPVT